MEKEEKKSEYRHIIFQGTAGELQRKFEEGCYKSYRIVSVINNGGLITVFFERED